MGKPEEEQYSVSPETVEQYFDRTYKGSQRGQWERPNEDGPERSVRSYELIIDPMDDRQRRSVINQFAHDATRAGYKEALSPIVIPNIGYQDTQGQRPLTAVYFFLEKPVRKQEAETPPQPTPDAQPPYRIGRRNWRRQP